MKLSLCLAACMVFGIAASAGAVGMGTIETGGGADLHLSPEPWSIEANMHLIYFFSPMMGIGPYWSVMKMGKMEGEDEAPPMLYSLGALGKLYLPMVYMEGKMTPFVMAGFGIFTLETLNEDMEWDTENKAKLMVRVGFDYWLTENWTVWTGYQLDKPFVDDADMMHSIKVGISTFIVK